MSLTVIGVEKAKPKDKPYKLADKDGLFLLVNPNGGKYWRWKYRFAGKEKLMAFGVFPEIGLGEARDRVHDARKTLRGGKDPGAERKVAKAKLVVNHQNTFRAVAMEWHGKKSATWDARHAAKVMARFEKHVFPHIGNRPMSELEASELSALLSRIEARGTTEILRRVCQVCQAVCRYAKNTGRCRYNVADGLYETLKPHKAKNLPSIKADELPDFLAALEKADVAQVNKLATKLLLHTFLRTWEMRNATWDDIDWKAKVWTVPARFVKTRVEHRVPLSPQVVGILTSLRELTGHNPHNLLFPAQHRQKNPMMCEQIVNGVIAKMGYKGRQVGHAFRSVLSTTLNEKGFKPDVIERQLAHRDTNKVRRAYNHAEYWDERVAMMDYWSDFLDAKAKMGMKKTGIKHVA